MTKITKELAIGPLTLGGNNPVLVQSMTNTHTSDIDATIAQINRLAAAGCELIRVAVPTPQDTAALPAIIKAVSIPVAADVHFHYKRALEAIEAGVVKIRLNPGNIQDRQQVNEVIAACKANGTAIRIGVNEGSIIESKDKALREKELTRPLPELMVEKMAEYLDIFDSCGFDKLILSAKCHDARTTIDVNRLIAKRFDLPIHLGVTHAGLPAAGGVRSAVALGVLLEEGIGNTIRVSLAGDPINELTVAWEILTSLGLRKSWKPELIVCPTCGRCQVNLLDMAQQVEAALIGVRKPVTVAVMGCVVNGPGEAADADLAICGGHNKVAVYKGGQLIATTGCAEGIEILLKEIEAL